MDFDYGIDLDTLVYSTEVSDFDYGTDEVITDHVGDNLKKWPTEGKFTLLLDADSIPYIVGYTSDDVQYCAAQRHPNGVLGSREYADKCDHANFLLNDWANKAGADSVKLYVTNSEDNFRLKLVDYYKAQDARDAEVTPKPPFFYEIKQWLIDEHDAIISERCEADDEVSIEAWKRHAEEDVDLWTMTHKQWSNFIIGSMDKDLNIIPGWHVDRGTGEKYWVQGIGEFKPVWKEREVIAYEYWPLFNGEPKDPSTCSPDGMIFTTDIKWQTKYVWSTEGVVQDTFSRGKNKGKGKFKRVKAGTKMNEYLDKLKGTGLKFFYSQILTGDPTDNYPGLTGCGAAGAYEALRDCKSEWELLEAVRSMYAAKNATDVVDAMILEQGQLAWMQTRKDELWKLPLNSNVQSFPL